MRKVQKTKSTARVCATSFGVLCPSPPSSLTLAL